MTVRQEGKRTVRRHVKYYDLDVIISVGYRVKSLRGTRFRQWANRILKEYLLHGYSINKRFERIEQRTYDTFFSQINKKTQALAASQMSHMSHVSNVSRKKFGIIVRVPL